MAFGILAPVTVRIMLAAPAAFIAAIAGLAMLQALREDSSRLSPAGSPSEPWSACW